MSAHLENPPSLPSTKPNPAQVKQMFSLIAQGYDRANNYLSAGIHHRWRKRVVDICGTRFGDSVLDCATGTGDLAIEFKKAVGDAGHVTGIDFCEEMLERAPEKAAALDLNIKFQLADVTELPFANESFDVVSISFGIRNVGDIKKALAEMHRVLRPSGTLVVLEFGQPSGKFFSMLYSFYTRNILPKVGGWLTGKPEAYTYLESSAAQFPCREQFIMKMLEAAPFAKTYFESLSGGIAYIYTATKAAR